MGLWSWWSSGSSPSTNDRPTLTNHKTPELGSSAQEQQPHDRQNQQTQSDTPIPRTAKAKADALDREEAALEELRGWFDKSSQPSLPVSSKTAPPQPEHDVASIPAEPSTSSTEGSLYPDTLKCSQCFDAAYYCSSIGGQLTNVYRYGGLRSCSDLWAQWRFCMRTKSMSDEERRRRIREWNRDKEVRRRVARNSEEVWALRRVGEGDQDGRSGIGGMVLGPKGDVQDDYHDGDDDEDNDRGWEKDIPAFVPGRVNEHGEWVGKEDG